MDILDLERVPPKTPPTHDAYSAEALTQSSVVASSQGQSLHESLGEERLREERLGEATSNDGRRPFQSQFACADHQ